MTDQYVTDEAHGEVWRLLLGDSCERLAELDESSVDLAVYSPPFASLFTYSPSDRDLGNSRDRGEFLDHYGYVSRAVLRALKPGRLCVVHVQQLSTTKATHGVVGLTDFRGQVIAQHERDGWVFHGEVTVDKDPQAQAIRTKAHALMFATLERDSASNRPAMADYLLAFRKPGDNAIPVKPECDRETWIEWARPIWRTDGEMLDAMDAGPFQSCWYGIRETNTLNTTVAKDNADERHICPLQLDLIERCVRLWSNRGETVLSPFAGIGSEGWVSVKHGRRFVGVELKPSYWRTAVENLRRAEYEASLPALFEDGAA
jgi:DNA modification methylase